MHERPANRVWVIQRGSHQEARVRVLVAVNMYPVGDHVVHFRKLKLIDEMPVATKPRVRARAQLGSLLIAEVRLWVNESDGRLGASCAAKSVP